MAGPRGRGHGPGGNGEKPQDRKKVLKRLWTYLYRYKFLLLLAVVLSVTSNLLNLVAPKLSGEAIDAIGTKAGGVDFPRVIFCCVLMIVFYMKVYLMVMVKKDKIDYKKKDFF